jgi:hypothetical protein
MLVAYFTTDEVNEWAAERMAAECGLTLCSMFLHGEQPDGFDPMLYDWDYLPPRWREKALAILAEGPLPLPVAVHGYHLAGQQVQDLRARGVHVWKRLRPAVFQELRRELLAVPASAILPVRRRQDRSPTAREFRGT